VQAKMMSDCHVADTVDKTARAEWINMTINVLSIHVNFDASFIQVDVGIQAGDGVAD